MASWRSLYSIHESVSFPPKERFGNVGTGSIKLCLSPFESKHRLKKMQFFPVNLHIRPISHTRLVSITAFLRSSTYQPGHPSLSSLISEPFSTRDWQALLHSSSLFYLPTRVSLAHPFSYPFKNAPPSRTCPWCSVCFNSKSPRVR